MIILMILVMTKLMEIELVMTYIADDIASDIGHDDNLNDIRHDETNGDRTSDDLYC